MNAPSYNGEPGAMSYDDQGETHADGYTDPLCPECEATVAEGHHDTCSRKRYPCPVCQGPSRHAGEICGRCRLAA